MTAPHPTEEPPAGMAGVRRMFPSFPVTVSRDQNGDDLPEPLELRVHFHIRARKPVFLFAVDADGGDLEVAGLDLAQLEAGFFRHWKLAV